MAVSAAPAREQQQRARLATAQNRTRRPEPRQHTASQRADQLNRGGALEAKSNGTRAGQSTQQKPSLGQRTNKLAKQAVTGKRDQSKSLVKQGLGEAGARGGQVVGGMIGTVIPFVGNAVGAIIGKRVGRLAGEHPVITLIILGLGVVSLILIMLLPFIMVAATIMGIVSYVS